VQSCPPYVQNLLILAQLYGALPRGTWVRKFMSGVTRGIEAAETKGAGTAPKLPWAREPKDPSIQTSILTIAPTDLARGQRTVPGAPLIVVAGWRPISGALYSVLARWQSPSPVPAK
jgi:hypothetical protein